ncbi:MAG: hypothetical protein M1819_002497 [Sarea resinae]|nr:MAG: hypothetical protein M1819_002497 [Sarea resinae]
MHQEKTWAGERVCRAQSASRGGAIKYTAPSFVYYPLFRTLDHPANSQRSAETSIAIVINESAKRELIDLYFAHVQPTYPMFCKQSFEQDLAEKKIPDALFNAMLALASRFIPVTDVPALLGSLYPAPWDDFARLAERQMQDQEDKNTPILLNDIKAFALLTLYEYTKFPGRRAWMMVGNLVRMALSIGLHCLDSGQQSLSLSDFELEEHRFVWWTVWNLDSAINTLTGAPCGIESDNTSTALVSTSVADFTAGKSTQSTQQFLPVDSERIWKSAQQLLNNDTEDGTNMYYLAICHLRHVMAFRRRLYTNPTPQSARHLTVLRNSLSYMRLSLPSWYFEPARQLLLETPDKHRLRLESLLILLISQIHVLEPITNTQLADIMRDDDLGNWVGCISIGEDIAAIFKAWRPGYFTGADPITSTIIWYTTCILTIHTMSNFGQFDEIPDQRLVSALDLLSLALDRFAQHWQISRILADALKSLQGWAWVRLGLSDIVSLLSQLRVPIDPMKQDPGTFNMWQIVEQAASVMAEIDGLSSPRAQRLDTSPAKPGV